MQLQWTADPFLVHLMKCLVLWSLNCHSLILVGCGGTCVTENEQGWKLWIMYSLVFIIQNGIQQVNVSNTVCFTIYWAYGKQTCSVPTECHVCTNFHCCPFSLRLNTFFTLSWPQHKQRSSQLLAIWLLNYLLLSW